MYLFHIHVSVQFYRTRNYRSLQSPICYCVRNIVLSFIILYSYHFIYSSTKMKVNIILIANKQKYHKYLFSQIDSLYCYRVRYEVQWYITPLHIQKLILFLLLRGNKSFGLNVGGLFVSSLQCFATV